MKKLIGTPLVLVLMCSAAPVWAAAPGGAAVEATDVGEIVVTARKREEKLQDVPLTISVVGAELIARSNLNNVSDLANQTPGFSYKQGFGRSGGGGGAGVRPSIRGMSSVVGAPNAAFFVDGVFVSDNIASYQLDNLERVEIIKGPQSALFGRQTFSGAINYVTRKPTNELSGKAKITYAEYNNFEASGFVSGPIIKDVLLFELNARRYNFGGDYVNADSGKRDLGAQKSTNVGGKLLFRPTSNIEIIGNLGYSRDRDTGYVYNPQGSGLNNCFAPPITTNIPFPTTPTNRRGFYCGEIKTLKSYAYNNDAIEALGYSALQRQFIRSSVSATYTTDDGFSLTSVTAYNTNKSITGQDNTLAPSLNPAVAVDLFKNSDFSQEVRIQTPSDKRIRALAGAYYYAENVGEGWQLDVPSRQRRAFQSDDGVRSKSVFGMIEGDATDKLTVGAEVRFQSERILGSTEVLAAIGSAAPLPTGQKEIKFSSTLPRFTARYKVSDDLTLHATAAKGNKPGGFNNYPADISASDATFFNSVGFDRFNEESAWSYEVGAKGRVAGWVNYSVAAFYTDWKTQQLSRGEVYTRLNGTPNSVVIIQNAGESEIKGFEFDLSGKPADWLFVRAGYAYVDAKFTKFFDDTTQEIYDTDGRPAFLRGGVRNPLDVDSTDGGDVSGNQLPQTPKHQFIVSGEVTKPIGSLDFIGHVDLAYESKRFTQVDNLNWAGDSYNMNASLALRRDNWEVSLFARNLLDDKTPLVTTRILDFNKFIRRINPFTGANQTTFFRDFYVSAPRKRQFGATASVKF